MSFLVEIVDGLARLLDAAEVATYRPDGVYETGETAITDTVMPDRPDRAVVLTAYDTANSQNVTDTTVFVQARTRAAPIRARWPPSTTPCSTCCTTPARSSSVRPASY